MAVQIYKTHSSFLLLLLFAFEMDLLKIIYLLVLVALGFRCCAGFSLVAVGWLLIAADSLAAGQGLWGVWASVVAASRLWSTESLAVVHGLSCSVACGILPGRGLYLCLLHWPTDFSSLSHQGSPHSSF